MNPAMVFTLTLVFVGIGVLLAHIIVGVWWVWREPRVDSPSAERGIWFTRTRGLVEPYHYSVSWKIKSGKWVSFYLGTDPLRVEGDAIRTLKKFKGVSISPLDIRWEDSSTIGYPDRELSAEEHHERLSLKYK